MNDHKAFLLALVALSCFASVGRADEMTSSGLTPVLGLPSAEYEVMTKALSSDVVSQRYNYYNAPTFPFIVFVPGVSLPALSTIVSATLSFDFPGDTVPITDPTTSVTPIVPYIYTGTIIIEPWSGATYSSVFAQEGGGFTSVGSLGISAPVPPGHLGLYPNPEGTIDLLALGFGADIQAGDSIDVYGRSVSAIFMTIASTGNNAITITDAEAITISVPTATLDVVYTPYSPPPPPPPAPVPEPASLILLLTVLLAVAFVERKRIVRG
jgi:hypothetical protein